MFIRHAAERALALALVLISSPSTAVAQDSCLAGDGHWGGGPPEAVEHWSGNGQHLLAIGNGAVLELHDSSVATAPVKLGEVLVGDPVRSIDISPDGQLASVSDHRNHVHVIDIGNRAAPVKRGRYATTGLAQPYGMDIVGNRLYVAIRTVGLRVLDITNPDAPALLGQSNGAVSDFTFDVEVRNNHAYLAQRADGVQIVDIGNPAAPTVVGAHAASIGAADIRIVGTRAYVTRGSEGVDILDLTNPTAPTRLSTFAASDGYLFETDLIGTQHVAVSSFSGTFIYSITNPSSPTLAGQIGSWHYRLATRGTTAYTSASGGLYPSVKIIDVSNPASPSMGGAIDGDGNSEDVSMGSGRVFVAAGERGLVVLDAGNPLAPAFAGRITFADEAISTVEYVNGVVAAGGGANRIRIVDAHSQAVPQAIATITLPGPEYALDLAARATRLYAATGTGGLRAYDLSTPASPQLAWQWTSPDAMVLRVAVDAAFAYVSQGPVLRVLQLNDSVAPTLIQEYTLPTGITHIAAAAGFVHVATLNSGVRVLDNRVPGSLGEVASIDVGSTTAYGVAIEGDRLYIAANELSGLLVYDITDPTLPQFLEQRNTSGEARKVAARNGIVALAEYGSGVRTFICDADAADRIFRNGFDPP